MTHTNRSKARLNKTLAILNLFRFHSESNSREANALKMLLLHRGNPWALKKLKTKPSFTAMDPFTLNENQKEKKN